MQIMLYIMIWLVFYNRLSSFKSTTEYVDYPWISQALFLQRQLNIDSPLNQMVFLGTHNSYNSNSYTIPFLSYIDPNQELSVFEQLELGVRSLEYDAHWFSNYIGAKDILLCHGQKNHLGCSPFDRTFNDGLLELRRWLTQNPSEIVLLYIERHLDGHEPRLAATLNKTLGDYIYYPSQDRHDSSCKSLPNNLTIRHLLDTKKQLIIVTKGCDHPSKHYYETDIFTDKWNNIVFAGIASDNFQIYDTSIDKDFYSYPKCSQAKVFEKDPTHNSLWRMFDDHAFLSNFPYPMRKIQPFDVQTMLRCHINWPSFDMLKVNDPRLRALVWSWAEGYPKITHGKCSFFQKNLGIKNSLCKITRPGFACQQEKSQRFFAISTFGLFAEGEKMCREKKGGTWHFSVPKNLNQKIELEQSMDINGLNEVWLNYKENNDRNWLAP